MPPQLLAELKTELQLLRAEVLLYQAVPLLEQLLLAMVRHCRSVRHAELPTPKVEPHEPGVTMLLPQPAAVTRKPHEAA